MNKDLFSAAYACLMATEVDEKVRLTQVMSDLWQQGVLSLSSEQRVEIIEQPGRPERPLLVPANEVRQRKLGSIEGRAALLHAIAHIEFNAIDLACDAIYRFREMPREYYDDWVQVAFEEAYHFGLLHQRLHDIDYCYGDFTAHNGLWQMALKTMHDPLVRMALVPRFLEARGLDVTPGIIKKLANVGDQASVDVLEIILRDEIGHVAIGSRWFAFFCEQKGLEVAQTYRDILDEYLPQRGRKVELNEQARMQAGFSADEIRQLRGLGR